MEEKIIHLASGSDNKTQCGRQYIGGSLVTRNYGETTCKKCVQLANKVPD